MSDKFHSRSSGIFGALLIALLIASFMFSGYDSMMRGRPDTLGKVGGLPISVREYQNEYSRQIEFYKQIMGGMELTQKQIDSFNIKDSVLKNLINKKLLNKLSEKIGVSVGKEELKKQISSYPYFKKNDKFDVELYKNLLNRNGLSPSEFEKQTTNDIKFQKAIELFQQYPVSQKYVDEIVKYKNVKISGTTIEINKKDLAKFITVTDADIKSFLNEAVNKAKVEAQFKKEKASLDLENKDKKNSKEAVYADHEKRIAELLLKESKTKEVDELSSKITSDIKSALESNPKAIDAIKSKYAISVNAGKEYNIYEGLPFGTELKDSEKEEIFKTETISKVFTIEKDGKITIFQAKKWDESAEKVKNLALKAALDKAAKSALHNEEAPQSTMTPEEEKKNLQTVLSQKMREDLLKQLEKDVPVKIFKF